MALNKVLKASTDSELMSYIINVTPELASEIDLPVQGESLQPIGKLIISNERMKNAFINTVNLIGLTVIQRNYWENPWEYFTEKGVLNFGDSIRELAVDIADVFDYNEFATNPTHFLENVVPNVYNYIHPLNFQKFYKTTTSDEQIAMAFNREGDLMTFIEEIVASLYKGYEYDKFLVNKYMLQRRILDGTITSVNITNYASLSPREVVSFIKNISNKMTFMSPNYNPAGLRLSSAFDRQIAIVSTDFDAVLSTEVLATSFFRDSAEMKTRMALIDSFGSQDVARLIEVLGSQFVPFTDDELTALSDIPAMIIDFDFFQNYTYSLDNASEPYSAGINGTRATNFYNPESLKNNHWLHTWKVFATSPFKQAVVFNTSAVPSITGISINPSESTVSAGIPVQLTTTVETTGFANKAVVWAVDEAPGEQEGSKVTVDMNGLVTIPKDYISTDPDEPNPIVISATSVYDSEQKATATITVL